MSKPESNNNWDSFDATLDMFEPDFKIERDQGIQEIREPLNGSVELNASFSIKDAADVKKPLTFDCKGL